MRSRRLYLGFDNSVHRLDAAVHAHPAGVRRKMIILIKY